MNTQTSKPNASGDKLKNIKKLMRKQSNLVDLAMRFASLDRPSQSSISMFKEQFYTLVLSSTPEERRAISDILSESIYAPRAIILFMAMEEIAISKSVLENSPVLKSNDLASVLTKTELEHARAICRRQDLEASTITSLMKKNDEANSIKTLLLNNPHVMQSPELLTRIEDTQEESWVEAPAENVTTFEMPQEQAKKKPAKDLSTSLFNLANRGGKLRHKPAGKKPAQVVISKTVKQMEQRLLDAARSMNLNVLTQTIHELCVLKREIAASIIMEENTGMLASLLRALNVSEISAARIMLLLNRNIGRNQGVFKTVMQKYKTLDRIECMAFFSKMGAEFKVEKVIDPEDSKRTRFAMSLAARERRSALLARQKELTMDQELTKQTA